MKSDNFCHICESCETCVIWIEGDDGKALGNLKIIPQMNLL